MIKDGEMEGSRFEELAGVAGMDVNEVKRLDALSRTAELDPDLANAIGRPEGLRPAEKAELDDLLARYNQGIDKVLETATAG